MDPIQTKKSSAKKINLMTHHSFQKILLLLMQGGFLILSLFLDVKQTTTPGLFHIFLAMYQSTSLYMAKLFCAHTDLENNWIVEREEIVFPIFITVALLFFLGLSSVIPIPDSNITLAIFLFIAIFTVWTSILNSVFRRS